MNANWARALALIRVHWRMKRASVSTLCVLSLKGWSYTCQPVSAASILDRLGI